MSIRRLRDDEPLPPHEPKRYHRANGYVILRWRVGVEEYVEVYEHRIIAGRPVGKHVHHINRNRADNRPENLKRVTSKEHGAEHVSFDLAEACRLYELGWTLHQLSRRYGVHHVTVLRALKARGVQMRPAVRPVIPVDEQQVITLFQQGLGIRTIAAALGRGTEPVYRVMRTCGLRRGPGRVAGGR